MLSYAPNVSWLFSELPFNERPAVAAKAGFTAIEFGFPSHADLDALDEARKAYGLQIVLFNQDVPVWDEENRGYLVDPKRRDEFRRKLDEALEIARRLGVRKIMLPAGVVISSLDRRAQRDCMIDNLLYAAALAEDVAVLLTIEALNPQDNPGYFLTTSQEGFEIVKSVAHPHVRFQFDTYHIQMMEGGLEQKIRDEIGWIGHIQFADYPGRHEPGSGVIDFKSVISAIQQSGYQDCIGLEYIPLLQGSETLNWAFSQLRLPHI